MLTRFLLAALIFFAPTLAGAQTGTFRSKPSMQTEINGQLPDNTSGAITPAIVRQVTSDQLASWQQAPTVNAQLGTAYTLSLLDFGAMVTFNNAAPVAFSIAAASTTGFIPFSFYAANFGAGAVTITPVAGLIAGAATYSLAQNGSILVVSDGTNWQVVGAAGSAGAGCTVTGVITGFTFNNGSSGCNTSTILTESGGTDTESGILNISGTFQVAGFTMTFPAAASTVAVLTKTDQTVTGGANVNPATNGNLGTLSGGGTTTLDCGLVPLQFFTNNGSFTLAPPANDGSCVLLMTNGASAAGTFTKATPAPMSAGFTIGTNVGDTYATANGNKYLISVTRVNGVATWFIKALQ